MSVKFHGRHIVFLLLGLMVLAFMGCSTKKNTSQSRWWHSFNARYNTYYNGAQAYIDASLEKENGNKDNFTEMIPLYVVGNKTSIELGKSNYDRAIEKAQKAIAKHSIKKRPEWNKSRRKTEKDIEWLSRREYNPFLWKAWMLMGRSQFHKGAFDEAAATFSYMSRLYRTQPAIYGKARAWLAKCYIEQDWLYDAEDVIRNMSRDSLDWRAVKEWDYTYADYYIHTGDFASAIPYLRKVIKHEMRRKQKAREWYLMGQLEAALGHNDLAYKAFQHVVRQNPPYELEFNARIAMTEVMAKGRSKQMISRLKRMAASDKNKEYLDQVYYAIGNIYLADKDTANAITAYEKGNTKATRSGIEKGVLLLHLGDLYWAKEKFSDARRCYGEAIGLLDKDRKDYEQLSKRSKILDDLVPYTDNVHLQDSLQELARMSEKDRNAAIDRVIEALKKKEKEEARAKQEQEAAEQQAQNGATGANNNRTNTSTTTTQSNGLWYFYNQMTVNQGKQTFQQQWGKRENVDDWQRVNKTVVGGLNAEDEPELTEEQRDSVEKAEALADSLSHVTDSAQNDPHKREYYLKQIPFTEEQIAESNKIIEDGLHHSGVIFKDRLDNLPLAEKALRRVSDDYPDYEQMADVYYHLFLLYNRKGDPTTAEQYVARLKAQSPDNEWTTVLTDPYFQENSRFGVHLEDSLYAATYEAFKADRYGEVAANTRLSETRFPLGANRDKFLFIGGLSKLNNGDADGCVKDMKNVVEKFPKSRISEMAGMIVNGVNQGKRLHGGKFDLGDVWSRRAQTLNDSDSIKNVQFTPDRQIDFKFLLVYHPDSVNENKLLFEMARYNFTNFLVRNFDIEIVDLEGLHQMQISGFRSFDEAYQYARQLVATQSIVAQMDKSTKTVIISDKNLELIGSRFSYADYEDFYAKHFATLKVETRYLLSEPAEVSTPRDRDIEERIDETEPTDEEINTGDGPAEDDFVIPEEPQPTDENGQDEGDGNSIAPAEPATEPAPTTDTPEPAAEDLIIEQPAPAPTPAPEEDNTFVLPEEKTPAADDNTFELPAETPAPQPAEEDVYEAPAPEPQPATPVTQPEEPVAAPEKPAKPVETKPVTKEEKPTATEEKPAPKETKPATATTTPEPAEQQPAPEPEEEPEDEDFIYFDDDEVPASNQKQAPADVNIEDEYYDLDGF